MAMRENVNQAALTSAHDALAHVDMDAEMARAVPIADFRPRVLPPTWAPRPAPGLARFQACYEHTRAPLTVLMSCKLERDIERIGPPLLENVTRPRPPLRLVRETDYRAAWWNSPGVGLGIALGLLLSAVLLSLALGWVR
jgi:hypothetical protein